MAPTAHTPPPDDALAAQLAAREDASRQDAAVLAPLRSEAAARALGMELPEGRLPAVPLAAARPLPTPTAPPAPRPPEAAAPADAAPAPATAPTAPEPASRPLPPGVVLPVGGPAPVTTGVLAEAKAKARPAVGHDDAVLELRPTVLATDVDRIGDQLVVMKDRLELRDRHGGLRRTLAIADITDVQVQRRLTSAVLAISTRTATDMVVKGLRPEAAESARLAILDLRPAEVPPTAPIDERALVRAILDLHRAGVLDDREAADKTALVARLAGRSSAR